jgi:hypothetical protein
MKFFFLFRPRSKKSGQATPAVFSIGQFLSKNYGFAKKEQFILEVKKYFIFIII